MTAVAKLTERAALTFRHERIRALSAGILEAAGNTFLLLIAVRWFHAGATAKALVAGAGSFGLLLSPILVAVVVAKRTPVSLAASRVALVGAVVMAIMAAAPSLPVFVVGSVLAMAASAGVIPLYTQMYQENYPGKLRGQLFARSFVLRIGMAALFSELAGRFLSGHLEGFRWVLLLFAGCFALSSWCLRRIPTKPLENDGGSHPFRALSHVRTDPVFRMTLICWMFMGFGNLMMLPLRVEYLANPKYGVNYTVAEIAFLTGVVPNMVRVILSPVWGFLFDRMNFFVLRVVLNLGFAAGITAFFTGESVTSLIIGGVIFGCSNAGGDVAWSLWVTKFAPPGRVADYMSVHTFFTGLRGVAAPLAAFHLAQIFTLPQLGWFCTGLILLASLLLLPETWAHRAGKSREMIIEEMGE